MNLFRETVLKPEKKNTIMIGRIPHELPQFKVILLGATNVGKTSIITSYKNKTFGPMKYNMTSATNETPFKVDVLDEDTGDHHDVSLKVWDTAGQEAFDSVTSSYYRKADAALIVYAVDSIQSFQECRKWA
jgi:small GTP-binding protein